MREDKIIILQILSDQRETKSKVKESVVQEPKYNIEKKIVPS